MLEMQILEKFGSRVPFVVSIASGILGRDVVNCEIKEVCWRVVFCSLLCAS